MVYVNQRVNSQDRAGGDVITAERLQDINEDLDALFKRLDSRNLTINYTLVGGASFVSQIIDNINTITINFDYSDFLNSPGSFTIQEVGDPLKYTIEYSIQGYPISCIYA